MSYCRVCTAPIIWATLEDGHGDRVPLDEHEQRDYGPGRYRIVADGSWPLIAPVPDDSTARTYVDHRTICQQPRPIG